MAKTPFLGSAYSSRSLNLAAQRCVNLFPEIVETHEGKDVGAFFGTPGKDLLGTIGNGPIRGARVLGSLLYVVSGNTLYSVTTAYVGTSLGTLATSSGPVSLVNNRTQMFMVDGTQGYVWDTSTSVFTGNVLAGLAANPVVATYQDGYGIVNDQLTQKFWQSNLNDFKTFGALNFSSADSAPSNIITMIDSHREVWLFGTNSTEVWINAGLPGFVFQRLQGTIMQQGCIAPFSPVLIDEEIMWLGQNDQGAGVVYQQQGYQGRRVSTHAIEKDIQSYSTMANAIGYAYQKEGHKFYVLTFPAGNKTWVYDLTASALAGVPMWHERAYFSNGAFSRDLGNCHVFFNGKNIVGDYTNGKIYGLNLDTYQDNGVAIKRLRSWRAFKGDGNEPRRYNVLELDAQTGINVPAGVSPLITLRYSDDGAHTWSNEIQASLGKSGETAARVMWTRLGTTKKGTGTDRVWEISHTENIPTAFIGAEMDAEPT